MKGFTGFPFPVTIFGNAMRDPPHPSELSPTDSASAQLIGLMLNWGLFGFLVAQVFTYFTCFPNDHIAHKSLVHVIFIFEVVQTALLTYDRYITFVTMFGDPLGPELIRTSWFSVPILCGILGCISQTFYAQRIYKISKSKMLSGTVLVLSAVQLISSIIDGVFSCKAKYIFELGARPFMVTTALWLLSTVICDVLIAMSMIYFLLVLKRDFHQTTFNFSKLISLTIETGTVTASAALLTEILFVVRRKSQSFNVPGYILGKLYSNSLLRVLNSRVKVANGYSEPLSTAKPEITTTVPLSYSHGPINLRQTCSGPGECILQGNSGHDQKAEEV